MEEKKNSKAKRGIKSILFLIIIVVILISYYINSIKKKNVFYFINKLKKSINTKQKQSIRPKDNSFCDNLDPISMFNIRLKNGPKTICKTETSSHVCYNDFNSTYNTMFYYMKNGVICKMENVVLDPSKSSKTNITYKGPVDKMNLGLPILSNGFLNMKCDKKNDYNGYNGFYGPYFNSWNYNFTNKEEYEELAPGKTIFFLSRNQDSPNLFHGGSELINAISIMHLFNLKPEDIQIIFLESIEIKDDPFYDLYKNLVSRGGEPIYIKNLKQKYHISSGFHIPLNWDSPCMIKNDYQNCKYPTYTYKLLNTLVNKYLNVTDFKDNFTTDNEIYYYPKSVIDSYKSNITFNKSITLQWRQAWPKGRKDQSRLLGNGPQLADKLASVLPKNFLIRLVNTGGMSISEQISIMKKTDYLVGIHGAGLCLSVYLPDESIMHEVLHLPNMRVLVVMSSLSGHKTYSDYVRYKIKYDDNDNENIMFQPDIFARKVLTHMIENDYF